MNIVEKYVTGALFLILVYLLVINASGTNTVLGALSSFNVNAITALQGRSGSGLNVSVG